MTMRRNSFGSHGPTAKSCDETLAELRNVVARANGLRRIADEMVRQAVLECRVDALPWEQIGAALGTSKQAAQQRYANDTDPTETEMSETDLHAMGSRLQQLISGLALNLAEVPRTTGGPAGVFTIWFREELIFLGHASSSKDAKPSNRREADGARGRLVGLRRQPPKSVQRKLATTFSVAFKNAAGESDEKRSKTLLEHEGAYRLVECASSREAASLYEAATSWLPANGYRIPPTK